MLAASRVQDSAPLPPATRQRSTETAAAAAATAAPRSQSEASRDSERIKQKQFNSKLSPANSSRPPAKRRRDAGVRRRRRQQVDQASIDRSQRATAKQQQARADLWPNTRTGEHSERATKTGALLFVLWSGAQRQPGEIGRSFRWAGGTAAAVDSPIEWPLLVESLSSRIGLRTSKCPLVVGGTKRSSLGETIEAARQVAATPSVGRGGN